MTRMVIIVGVITVIALLAAQAVIRRRRREAQAAVRRNHEARQKEVHAWLIKDRGERAQRVMREGWGESDLPGTQILQWLKARQGRRLHVVYLTADGGGEVRLDGDWVVGSPAVFRDHRTGNPELIWTLPGPARAIELPARTYHEVEAEEGCLVYRRGWACWRPHESSEGLTSTHKREDVEVWEQYTLSEPR